MMILFAGISDNFTQHLKTDDYYRRRYLILYKFHNIQVNEKIALCKMKLLN